MRYIITEANLALIIEELLAARDTRMAMALPNRPSLASATLKAMNVRYSPSDVCYDPFMGVRDMDNEIVYVCGACGCESDEDFDICPQCSVPDQCYAAEIEEDEEEG